MNLLSHISLGVARLGRSIEFYDAVLAPLGCQRQWTGEKGAEYGTAGGPGQFAVFECDEQLHAPGAGFHVAFQAPSRDAVDKFYAAALRLRAHDEGAPGLRPHYGAGYYAAFVRDPDGHKLEAVFQE